MSIIGPKNKEKPRKENPESTEDISLQEQVTREISSIREDLPEIKELTERIFKEVHQFKSGEKSIDSASVDQMKDRYERLFGLSQKIESRWFRLRKKISQLDATIRLSPELVSVRSEFRKTIENMRMTKLQYKKILEKARFENSSGFNFEERKQTVYEEMESFHESSVKKMNLEKYLVEHMDRRISDSDVEISEDYEGQFQDFFNLDDEIITELFLIIETYSDFDSGVKKQYRKFARNLVNMYFDNYKEKEKLQNQLPENVNENSENLGKQWFKNRLGKQPQGKVSLELNKGMFILFFENRQDYRSALYDDCFRGRLDEDLEQVGVGAYRPGSEVEHKDAGTIFIYENPSEVDVKGVVSHERQHYCNNALMKDFLYSVERQKQDISILDKFKDKVLESSYIDRASKLTSLKDELLAYIKGGGSVGNFLLNENYYKKFEDLEDRVEIEEVIMVIEARVDLLLEKVVIFNRLQEKNGEHEEKVEKPSTLVINYLYEVSIQKMPEKLKKLIFYYEKRIDQIYSNKNNTQEK